MGSLRARRNWDFYAWLQLLNLKLSEYSIHSNLAAKLYNTSIRIKT